MMSHGRNKPPTAMQLRAPAHSELESVIQTTERQQAAGLLTQASDCQPRQHLHASHLQLVFFTARRICTARPHVTLLLKQLTTSSVFPMPREEDARVFRYRVTSVSVLKEQVAMEQLHYSKVVY